MLLYEHETLTIGLDDVAEKLKPYGREGWYVAAKLWVSEGDVCILLERGYYDLKEEENG